MRSERASSTSDVRRSPAAPSTGSPSSRCFESCTSRRSTSRRGTNTVQHVAGILTADWRVTDDDMPNEHDLVGIAGLEVYDLRVLDENGEGDEFSLIAALQFVRHLNANKDCVVVHGVNASLSIHHDVANYAAAGRRVRGVRAADRRRNGHVVAAAGNDGYARFQTVDGDRARAIGASASPDSGNAENVITVGATHRFEPHPYRRLHFSSRGPTGDGRQARPRRARREDHSADPRSQDHDDGRHEHGRSARERRGRPADGALPRVRRATRTD